MISASKAMDIIHHHFIQLPISQKSLCDVDQMILAETIFAERDQPPFNRVAMDGIAVSHQENIRTFPIEGIQKAGEPQKILKQKNFAIEVMTGAPLPQNCNTVIPYEDLIIESNIAKIREGVFPKSDKNIHHRGKDYREGDVVLSIGTRITSPEVAVLTSQGLTQVKVLDYPTIAIISTGDELIDPGQKIFEHQIRRSNPYALASELKTFGIPSNKISLFHLLDNQIDLIKNLQKILAEYEVIIISGGVSMGKYDFVHSIMNDLKVEILFHKIKQRPGKPMLFGKGDRGQLIFGLPGNPVSALVCLRRYVIEGFIKKLNTQKNNQVYSILTEDIEFNKDFTLFLPVQITNDPNGSLLASPTKHNGSGDFNSLTSSDGFLELPEEPTLFKKDQAFPFFGWMGGLR